MRRARASTARAALALLALLVPLMAASARAQAAGAGSAQAASVPAAGLLQSLEGDLTQGGLVIGQVPQGARVTLDDRAVAVAADGHFVIGFGRDHPARAVLAVTDPASGRAETRPLSIAARAYDIQRIDGLPPGKVEGFSEETLARIRRENAQVAAARARTGPEKHFLDGFIWPVKGRISGVYGSQRVLNGKPRRPHFGVDVAAPRGTPVVAPVAGTVRLAARDHFFTGGIVIIDHGMGVSSTLFHLDTVEVEEGQQVEKGARIGTVGATGRATGPHLDWRVNWFGERLDPMLLAGPMPD